jgi:hypothetical protein
VSFIQIVAGLIDVLLAAEHDAAVWQQYAEERRDRRDDEQEPEEHPPGA